MASGFFRRQVPWLVYPKEGGSYLPAPFVFIVYSGLDARGINTEALLTPPSMKGAQAYCPRCKVEYLREEGRCSSCDGIPLVSRRQGDVLPG